MNDIIDVLLRIKAKVTCLSKVEEIQLTIMVRLDNVSTKCDALTTEKFNIRMCSANNNIIQIEEIQHMHYAKSCWTFYNDEGLSKR